MIFVKAEVLRQLFADLEWSNRLEKAETMQEIEKILLEYCKAKRLRVEAKNVKEGYACIL